jgi:hypothetical protein
MTMLPTWLACGGFVALILISDQEIQEWEELFN